MTNGAPLLELQDIHAYYGNIRALKGVSLSVGRGEIVTLIGSNGAGKTTTLRTVLGTVRPLRGTVSFGGRRIDRVPTHRIARLGIAQSPEGRRIFAPMTVLENLELGAFARDDREAIPADLERVLALFPRLRDRLQQKGGTLSGGEQQMLAMGRALMARPARGAERAHGPAGGASRVRHPDRAHRAAGRGLGAAPLRRGAQGLPGREIARRQALRSGRRQAAGPDRVAVSPHLDPALQGLLHHRHALIDERGDG